MVSFNISLADETIGVTALYDTTKRFCQKYLTEAPPSFYIKITEDDIRLEREKSDREARKEGYIPVRYSNEYLETLAVYRNIAAELLKHDILLFQGSAIAVDGRAYLFTFKSGAGKSIHVQLWKQQFGERAVIIDDDKVLLKIKDGEVIVYGTPWNEEHYRSNHVSYPLKAVCILERSEKNYIERIKIREALPVLCQQSYRAPGSSMLLKTLNLIDKLENSTRLYKLGCNMDQKAAQIAYLGMNK